METKHPDYYPTYSKPERLADGIMHVLGVVGSITASVILIVFVQSFGTVDQQFAAWVYGLCMVFAFCASAAYHFTPIEGLRPTLRRLDHAGIFLKIAGTYTPLVVIIGSGFSYFILGMVWAVALFGVIWKVIYWSAPDWRSTLLYVGLGWASLALAWPLIQNIPVQASILTFFGGLIYTLGVIFYRWNSLRFSVAIWHGFVLVASACFFAAIYISEMI